MGLIFLRFSCQRNKSHINPKQICGCRISLFSRIANADILASRIANSEERDVNVLRQAQAGIHKTEVISHTTKHHIRLHYREVAPMESIINKVLLDFLEGKR